MPLPPSLSGVPRIGSSPMAMPTGSPGAQAGAIAKVGEALKMLNAALPELPLGSEPYNKVSSVIQTLIKVAPPSAAPPGVQQTEIRNVQQNAGKNAMLQQVMASLGAGGAQPGGGSPLPSPAPQPGA